MPFYAGPAYTFDLQRPVVSRMARLTRLDGTPLGPGSFRLCAGNCRAKGTGDHEILCQCHLKQEVFCQKTGHQDLVTFWDRKIERQLRNSVLTAFPQDYIVGEKYLPEEGCGGNATWYLDPVDGTTNFINQHRSHAISIGCWKGGTPLFGMVLNVER